jgi:uncharacterized RDD family membrane protein YckC
MFKRFINLFKRKKREPRVRLFEPVGVERQEQLRGVEIASFKRRASAFAMDFTFVSLCLLPFLIPEALERMDKTGDLAINIDPFHGWEIISLPLYFGLWTYFGRGQTLGKKLMGIRVVSLTHDHLGFWHSIERSLGYGASILEGGFGFFQFFIYPNRQTLHDRIAETIVTKAEKIKDPAASKKEKQNKGE